eukprot:TRINITY_DN701_c0_g2_i14.p2 TRINITY_DN701_c0_g2~~TRINITY_DN701_c0_g2_i14.p2  ORF type:complete len:473 (+),score=120.92 TRINITY_DN701_c0_g2_i14:633-2051(+)
MRMTLLAPKTVMISSLFLPFAVVVGIFLVPTVAFLITVTTNGRLGMFQHRQSHDITKEVFLSGFWTLLTLLCCILLPLLLVGWEFQLGVGICSGLVLLPLLPAIESTNKESSMYLPSPRKNASFWETLPFRRIKIKKNLSNILSVFSIFLEFIQVLCLGYSASRPSLSVSVDTSFIGSLTQFTLRPLGTSLLFQFIVSVCLGAILIGFITVSIILTSQPEKRVARVSEQKELEGNLSWFKLLVATLADTLFLSLTSSMFAFLSASTASLQGDLDTSSSTTSTEMSESEFQGLSILALLQLFAFVSCALMIILPIQAVFPKIWLPDGIDVRASPKFSLLEKSLKVLLVGVLSVGPGSNVDLRSGFGIFVFGLLSVLIWTVRQPMTHKFAADIRGIGYVSAFGTVFILRLIPNDTISGIVFGAWMCCTFGGLGFMTWFKKYSHKKEYSKELGIIREVLHNLAIRCGSIFGENNV